MILVKCKNLEILLFLFLPKVTVLEVVLVSVEEAGKEAKEEVTIFIL